MKTNLIRSLLYVGLSVALIVSASAQTPTPAPLPTPNPAYLDFSLTDSQRAKEALSAQAALTPASKPELVESIAFEVDYLTLATATEWTPDIKTLAETLISNHGAYVTGAAAAVVKPGSNDNLMAFAAFTKARLAFNSYADRATFLLGLIQALNDNDSDLLRSLLNDNYLWALAGSANDLITAGQYEAAIAIALEPSLLNDSRLTHAALDIVLRAKTLEHAGDTISWAKLDYLTADFAHSQDASVLVASAFRAVDGNVTRANAFITAQTNAAGVNPLASVDVPVQFKSGPLPETSEPDLGISIPNGVAPSSYATINLILKGDKVGALKAARANYDSADSNKALNKAVEGIAAVLRDIDLNLIRANAYVSEQKSGQTYPIAELQ